MALVQNSAEGGTNGTTVTASNSGGASGDAFGQVSITSGSPSFIFSNNTAAHGSLSYRLTGVSGDKAMAYLFNGNATAASVRLYIYFDVLPSAGQTVLLFQNASYSMAAGVGVNASNNLTVLDTTGYVHVASGTLQASTWYRIELQATISATAATVAYQYYLGDSTSAVDTFSTASANTGTANIIRAAFGKNDSSPAIDANFDDFAFNSGVTTPVGPVVASNQAPTANAGPDQTNIEPWSIVTLDGSGSSDSDGTIASYAWTQTAGTTVSLSSTTASKPTFTAPGKLSNSTLTFSLIVTDNDGATSTADAVNISVLAATERAVIGGVEVPMHTQVVSGGNLV